MAKKSTSPRSRSTGSSTTTVDHDEIRQWAESRGGKPACVKGTGGRGDTGVLRIEFRDDDEESLHQIDWDEFFQKFDDQELALVYQDKTSDGKPSRFSKLISRDNADAKGGGASPAKGRSSGRTKSAGRPGAQTAKSTRGAKSKNSNGAARTSTASARGSASKSGGKSKAKNGGGSPASKRSTAKSGRSRR
jgi:hypothetical protein